MNIPEAYDYLVRSRRDLWNTLERAPEEVLSAPMLRSDRFRSIKDLVFHIAAVEDSWLHEDILGIAMVRAGFPHLKDLRWEPIFSRFPLGSLLEYWRAVEQATLRYLASTTEEDWKQVVALHDAAETRYTIDGLLWHVMTHEMRHSAQISMLLRMQGIAPPFMDLLAYLPHA